MISDNRSARDGADQLAVLLARIGIDAVVDGKGEDAGREREKHDRPDDGPARAAGGAETTSSESEFMTLSVWATAMTSAKGTTIGMIDGRMRAATSKKVSADWPLSVTRSMRGQHLRRPDDRQRPDQRCHEDHERAAHDVAFNDLHEGCYSVVFERHHAGATR